MLLQRKTNNKFTNNDIKHKHQVFDISHYKQYYLINKYFYLHYILHTRKIKRRNNRLSTSYKLIYLQQEK